MNRPSLAYTHPRRGNASSMWGRRGPTHGASTNHATSSISSSRVNKGMEGFHIKNTYKGNVRYVRVILTKLIQDERGCHFAWKILKWGNCC